MSANRRRKGPVPRPPVSAQAQASANENTTAEAPPFAEEEFHMGDQFEGNKKGAYEAKPVIEDKPAPAVAEPVMFALRRCRYKSGSKIVDAEAGDEIKNPDQTDLQDLVEHQCVETFDPAQVQALFSLRDKDVEARKRLARAIGIL